MSAYIHQAVQQATDTSRIEALLEEQVRIMRDIYDLLAKTARGAT